MNPILKDTIQTFCKFIPESKIGIYSPNPNDDRRLRAIYETAIAVGGEVKPSYILDCLKELYPNWEEKDLIDCADSSFKHMLNLI